jgi:hypothetical protein
MRPLIACAMALWLGACAQPQTQVVAQTLDMQALAPNTPKIVYRSGAAFKIALEAKKQLGPEWVPTALKIAKVESGFSCGAVGPRLGQRHKGQRALGLMQVLPSTARTLGYEGPARDLLDCDTGAFVGVMHMRRCFLSGAVTPPLMARCHVAGWNGFDKRSRYANQYVRLVLNAHP